MCICLLTTLIYQDVVASPCQLINLMKKLQSVLEKKIYNGEYTIRELIVPQKFMKTTICGNVIKNEEVDISERKIDISHIRKKLLEKNEKFIRKRSDKVFDNMDRKSIAENIRKFSEVQSSALNLEPSYLRNRPKSLERTRPLICRHDVVTIGGHGYIVIAISIVFDVNAFLSDEEMLLRSRLFT